MADILIRGMEMPKNEPLTITITPEGKVFRAFIPGSYGEAVPLPEGRGRLIDADELMEYIKNHEYELKSRMGCVGKGMFTYQIQEYANNHTIVPAEGGKIE